MKFKEKRINEIMDENIFLIYIYINSIINWYSSLINHDCLDFKRRLVYTHKTIYMSSSHGVHYLVHNSAL